MEVLGATNARGLSEHLGIGYETARSAMRRLEAAGYIRSIRQRGKMRTETVMYSLTLQGMQAALDEGDLSVPTDGYVPPSHAADLTVSSWRDLHDALGMGRAMQPRSARVVDRRMDQEPEGWRLQA